MIRDQGTIPLTEDDKIFASSLANNQRVLHKSEPSINNIEAWLQTVKNNMETSDGKPSSKLFYFINFLKNISIAVRDNSCLALEERDGALICASVGIKVSKDNLNRKSNLVVESSRIFIKVKDLLRIRFVINKDYIMDFDKKMFVSDESNTSFNKSSEGNLKHKNKAHLQARDVYFELDEYLSVNLDNYFSAFKLTDYYQECPILKEWMPAVFSRLQDRQYSDNLDELLPSTEDEYQNKVQEAVVKILDKGPIKKPQRMKQGGKYVWVRNFGVAKIAIEKANYKCLVSDTHFSFTSKKTGKQYVEAHHIFPMSSQDKFNYSLDVPENIAALCPNCHKQIHLAEPLEKKKIIKYLFDLKKDELK